MTEGPLPRVLHVASGRLDARVRDGIAELVGALDGRVGSHRLVTSAAGRRVVRRLPPDLVVAHGSAALVAATRRRRRPPVIYHPLPRADARAPWPRLARVARDHATLVLADAADSPDRWIDAVVALTGPGDAPAAHPPASMDDVLRPGPRVFRRSEDVLIVAGPAVDEPPLLLTGMARAAFQAVDGRRRLRDIARDLAGDADPAEVEAVVWDVATRGTRLGALS